MSIALLPAAKVNLGLAVTGRRADGYHELRSVFLRIGLCDSLGAERILEGPDALTVRGDPECPIDGNLVLKAAAAVRSAAPPPPLDDRPVPWLSFTLDKHIPLRAGLGGGSSDAAAALDLVENLTPLHMRAEARSAVALALGADVPFFVSGHAAALVEGVGERLQELRAVRGGFGLLLLVPPISLATRNVFAAYDALGRQPDPEVARTVEGLAMEMRTGIDGPRLADWATELRDANQLWPAAAVSAPDLVGIRENFERRVGRPALMTGSGAGLFALYASVAEAADAGRALAAFAELGLAGARLIAVGGEPVGEPAWRSQ